MDFLNHWLLTILIFLPSAGAILVLLAKGRDAIRWTALATTIVTFAASTGSAVIAEGVETADVLETLRRLGIGFAQGYHVGHAAPLDAVDAGPVVFAQH